jgi:hypothetical protein
MSSSSEVASLKAELADARAKAKGAAVLVMLADDMCGTNNGVHTPHRHWMLLLFLLLVVGC